MQDEANQDDEHDEGECQQHAGDTPAAGSRQGGVRDAVQAVFRGQEDRERHQQRRGQHDEVLFTDGLEHHPAPIDDRKHRAQAVPVERRIPDRLTVRLADPAVSNSLIRLIST